MRELYINIYGKKFMEEYITKFLIQTTEGYTGIIFILDCKKIYYVNSKFDYELTHPIPALLARYNKFFSKIVINLLSKEIIFIPKWTYIEPMIIKFV